nr:bacteriohemerythrin [uncultured Draconibacterium sp.]
MNLSKFEWTDILSVGNPEVDKDHKELLDIYNQLVDFIDTGGKREEFAEILSKMTDYCLCHFKKEEEYMKQLAYPELEKHVNYHRQYIYKVSMYNVDFLGDNPPAPEEIIRFLEKWWRHHILKVDVQYEAYKKEIESLAKYK